MSVGHTVLAFCEWHIVVSTCPSVPVRIQISPERLTDATLVRAPALSAPPWGSWGLCPSGVSGAPVVQQWLVSEF